MLNALVNGDLFVREKKNRGTEIRNRMQDIFFFFFLITEFMFFYLNANISSRHPV